MASPNLLMSNETVMGALRSGRSAADGGADAIDVVAQHRRKIETPAVVAVPVDDVGDLVEADGDTRAVEHDLLRDTLGNARALERADCAGQLHDAVEARGDPSGNLVGTPIVEIDRVIDGRELAFGVERQRGRGVIVLPAADFMILDKRDREAAVLPRSELAR